MREWNGSSALGSLGGLFGIVSLIFLAIAIGAGICYVFLHVKRNVTKKAGPGAAQGSDKLVSDKNKEDRIERGQDDR